MAKLRATVSILNWVKCMLSRCSKTFTRLVATSMSQPPWITGSSRRLAIGRPNNHPQPSTESSSNLDDPSVASLDTEARTARGIANTLVPYDWRTYTTNGQLHYIRAVDTANECIARIASRPSPVTIGLDLEWRPTFAPRRPENPIALVQLACDDEILLVQVSAMEGMYVTGAQVRC